MSSRLRPSRPRLLGGFVAAALSLLLAPPSAAQVEPPILTDLESTHAAFSEAMATTGAAMVENSACAPATLTYSGVLSSGAFNGRLTGTYAGMPLDVRIDSFFDVFYHVDYSGIWGPGNVTGVGRGDFDSSRRILLYTADGQFGPLPWDKHVIKNYRIFVNAVGQAFIMDDGLIVITRNRKPIGKWKQTSKWSRQFPFRHTITKIRVAPAGPCKLLLKETATPTPTGETVTGTLRVSIPG
jgi:hypothetical protein